ncbi:MAG: efflux transporter outer membrane subunit [Planctomycetes bacterium]|nr:efflux transporter outer membrane subunit [Planctomycetota bacterium]
MSRPVNRPAFLLPLALAACAVGPDYEPAEPPTPSAWNSPLEARVSADRAELARWWERFDDPVLASLIERAIAANHDVRLAAARIREARAALGIEQGELLPEVGVDGGLARGRSSENGWLPSDGESRNLREAGYVASWEIDLFGGRRRAVEAADADLAALVEERRAVLVAVLGDVAGAYVELRGQQQLAAIGRRNAEAARATLELTRARSDAGLATTLDVARAESQLHTTESYVPEAERAARQAIHRLSLLLGSEPGALAAELTATAPIPVPPSRIDAGLPAELMTRRPDVRRAEREAAAAVARVGVATAELYPKFTLLGSWGAQSIDLADLGKPASRVWESALSLQLPLFAGGAIRAGIEAADARAEQSQLALERTWIGALREVEDALTAYAREWERRGMLEAGEKAGRDAVALADELHQKGFAGFLDVLDAERNLYASQRELARSETAVATAAVALYRGLAGGWEVAP